MESPSRFCGRAIETSVRCGDSKHSQRHKRLVRASFWSINVEQPFFRDWLPTSMVALRKSVPQTLVIKSPYWRRMERRRGSLPRNTGYPSIRRRQKEWQIDWDIERLDRQMETNNEACTYSDGDNFWKDMGHQNDCSKAYLGGVHGALENSKDAAKKDQLLASIGFPSPRVLKLSILTRFEEHHCAREAGMHLDEQSHQ